MPISFVQSSFFCKEQSFLVRDRSFSCHVCPVVFMLLQTLHCCEVKVMLS